DRAVGHHHGVRGVRAQRARARDLGPAESRHDRLRRRGGRVRDRARASVDLPDRRSPGPLSLAGRSLRVTVWNEHIHERRDPSVRKIYPEGMHAPILDGIRRVLGEDVTVRVATLEAAEHGLSDEVLAETDVLTWWGHAAHDQVRDEVVERVHARVLDGMGIVVLHSGHYSKIFKRLMGTSCSLIWRSDPGGEREIVWTVNPAHPIAAGVP